MLERIIERLSSLGYGVGADDEWTLEFILDRVESQIRNKCNIPEIPGELSPAAVDLAVSQFLLEKKATGGLEGFDLESAVKQVQEGDTSVTYALGEGSLTPEARLDALIGWLVQSCEDELAAWRRIRW